MFVYGLLRREGQDAPNSQADIIPHEDVHGMDPSWGRSWLNTYMGMRQDPCLQLRDTYMVILSASHFTVYIKISMNFVTFISFYNRA